MNIIGKNRIKEDVALHQDRLTGTDAFLVDVSPNSANGFEMTKFYTIKTENTPKIKSRIQLKTQRESFLTYFYKRHGKCRIQKKKIFNSH